MSDFLPSPAPLVKTASFNKVGVLCPSYQRPDFARNLLLQLAHQSRPPEVVCIHQNGSADCYDWVVEGLKLPFPVRWLFTDHRVPQHEWYSKPLFDLIQQDCDAFLWMDHDDWFSHRHIEQCLADLVNFDFRISNRADVLFVADQGYEVQRDLGFVSHAPGGMSSSMAFNRAFAEQLLMDLMADNKNYFADNVLATVTMPKFRCLLSNENTTTYVCHGTNVSSQNWYADFKARANVQGVAQASSS